MIALLGGLGAACAWAVSTVCSSRSSRLIDPASVVGWVMIVGVVIAAPIALAGGVPPALGGSAGAWLAIAGAGNVTGLLFAYGALRIGQVAVVAPVVATEGAMAALIAVVAGESITPSVGVALAACAVGISLASTPPAADTPEREVVGVGSGDLVGTEVDDVDSGGGPAHAVAQGGHDGEPRAGGRSCHSHARAIGLAIGAATAFGASLYAAGRAGSALPAAWVAAAARLIGVPVLALPLALTGRLRLIRAAVPFVVASGLCEVLGFYSYTAGARHGIAVAAVLSSQFGTVAAVAGYLLLGERISRLQLCGVAATVGGVLALSVLST